MNNNWNTREFERIWGLMIDEPEEQDVSVTCPYCGGSGNQEWFETHEHGSFDPIPEIPVHSGVRMMHMYCWYRPSFIAIAQAESVAAARELVLIEIGYSDDGSCPERETAYKFVKNYTPDIWHCPNAEFVLTDSAELREVELQSEKRRAALLAAGIEDPK